MLVWRLISTTIMVSVLAALVAVDVWLGNLLDRPAIVLGTLALCAVVVASLEMCRLFDSGGIPYTQSVIVAAVAITFAFSIVPMLILGNRPECSVGPFGWITIGLLVGSMIHFLHEMKRFREPGESVQRVAIGLFTVLYLGTLMGFLALLRFYKDNQWGVVALISMVAIVKMSDSGAYAVGKLMGRRKMAPILSPGKTVEGAIGAIVTGIATSLLIFMVIIPRIDSLGSSGFAWWQAVAYGLAVTIAGMIGDLAESLIKRDMRQKDASHIVPGLGGVLDVFDSLLFAAPTAYICWVSGLMDG